MTEEVVMEDEVRREIWLSAAASEVWTAVTTDGWLAPTVEFDLRPGGDARFGGDAEERRGWVEEACAPGRDGRPGRLAFWWATDDEAASRVEITVEERGGRTRVSVAEARPLDVLDLVGVPLGRPGGRSYGPALAA